MADDILVILDICLQRIRSGETQEQCLGDFPEYRSELETMLRTVQTLSVIKQVTPSTEFRRDSHARLMSQIRTEAVRKNQGRDKSLDLSKYGRSLVFRTLVPVTLIVLVALIVWAALPLFSPAPVSASGFTLSLLKGSVEVRASGSAVWFPGTDGMNLDTGISVRTVTDSYALLTFFDGSTVKLEPGAEVQVSRSEYNGQISCNIELVQQSGKTWSYVMAGGEEPTYFAVQTPWGRAVAQGTAFSSEVESSGQTRFAVMEGAIQIVEGDREILLDAGQQIQVGNTIALSTPQPAPPPRQEFIISTGLPGIGSVRDPSGASTGYFPDGMAFNQITNSKSVLSSTGQQILIEEPESGEYLLAVRSLHGEAVPVNIQAKQEGRVVFQYAENLSVPAGEGWLVRIKLSTLNQSTLSAEIVSFESLSGKAPEKVIEPDLAKKRAVPITPVSTQPSIPPAPETTRKPMETASPEQTQSSEPAPVITSPAPSAIDASVTPAVTVPDAKPAATVQITPAPVITPAASTNTSVTAATPVVVSPEPTKTTATGTGNTSGTAATPVVVTPEPTKTVITDTGDASDTAATPVVEPPAPTVEPATGTGDTSGTGVTPAVVPQEPVKTSSFSDTSSSGGNQSIKTDTSAKTSSISK